MIWLLEELELDYKLVIHGRDPKWQTALESLKKAHPLGKAPVLCDGEMAIAETAAIFDYLLENYGGESLVPQGKSMARNQYHYWRYCAEGTFMPYLATKQLFSRIESASPLFARPILKLVSKAVSKRYLNPNIHATLRLIEKQLHENTWICGDNFSAADILLGFLLEAISTQQELETRYLAIFAYITRMRHRAAYQRARAKGLWQAEEHMQYWSCLKL